MLTRRTFLTTIAAAPLARFCKTEPVRPYKPTWPPPKGYVIHSEWDRDAHCFRESLVNKRDFERRYNLPQGTLG